MEKKSGDKLTWLTVFDGKISKVDGAISDVITKEAVRATGKITPGGQAVSEILYIFDNSITWL